MGVDANPFVGVGRKLREFKYGRFILFSEPDSFPEAAMGQKTSGE